MQFTTGTYTGDGNDNRSISGVGFQPTFLTVKSAGATYAVWRVDENPGDDTLDFWASTNSANMVQAFEADGFQIGTSDKVNSNEVTYYYFAFKDIANAFQTGTYAGDGNDDRSLAASLTPEMVWVKGDLAASCYLRTDTMAAGDSGDFQNAALTTDRIQSFPTTNFQVGTSAEVNTLNETYYWAAWATPPGGAANAMPQAMNHYRRRR